MGRKEVYSQETICTPAKQVAYLISSRSQKDHPSRGLLITPQQVEGGKKNPGRVNSRFISAVDLFQRKESQIG
jgi:hypothetical protein